MSTEHAAKACPVAKDRLHAEKVYMSRMWTIQWDLDNHSLLHLRTQRAELSGASARTDCLTFMIIANCNVICNPFQTATDDVVVPTGLQHFTSMPASAVGIAPSRQDSFTVLISIGGH